MLHVRAHSECIISSRSPESCCQKVAGCLLVAFVKILQHLVYALYSSAPDIRARHDRTTTIELVSALKKPFVDDSKSALGCRLCAGSAASFEPLLNSRVGNRRMPC
jgi:hypothetical protein